MVLPLDVWQKVLSNLALRDLRVGMLVSQLWNQAIGSDSATGRFLWYQLYNRDFYALAGNFNFNQETNYKDFYKSLLLSFRQKTLTPLIKKAEDDLTKARATGASPSEVAAGYDKAIKTLETALKIQTQIKGDTTALTAIISDLKQELWIPQILKEASLYLPSEEEVAEFKQAVELYQDQDDPFSSWAEYIKAFEAEGLPLHLHFLAAALCEHRKDLITAACHYLELAEHQPYSLACLKKAASFVQKASDPFAYPHFLEKLDRDELIQLQTVANDSLSFTQSPQWTHRARSNVTSSGQLQQTTFDAELETWILQKDAIRMAFEECLDQLSRCSPQTQAPTCFVCFNVEEPDVGKWLEHVLVPDLDRMGIKPLFCFRDLGPGKELNNFQGLIRSADQVIIVCTPGLKKKCDERKKAPTGVAQEIRLVQERYNDPDKYETIFPLYLKGDRKSSCPSVFIEPILGTKFTYLEKSTEASVFSYYSSAFELLGGMRKVPRGQSRRMKEEFLKKVSLVLKGAAADAEQLKQWREGMASRHQQIKRSIQDRVSVNTQMLNLPLPPQHFTGREQELKALQEKCRHQHRVAVTGLGGVGKTALALQYANEDKAHYQFIHFMLAGSYQLITDGLLKLADNLHVPQTDKIEDRLKLLKTTLERFEKEYLLIFDGIDQIEAFQELAKYLPKRGRCLLLTSRMPQQVKAQKFEVIELKLFSIEEAAEYLLKATGLKGEQESQKLAELLGRLPLALTHAAGYIRSQKMSIQGYIKKFEAHQIDLFKDDYLTLPKEEKTILATWNMSIEAIEKGHNCSLARQVLEFFAFLGQAPIPRDLIERWFTQVRSGIPDLELGNALRYLCDYSMIDSSSPDTYDIHLLVQSVSRYQISIEKQQQVFGQIVTLFSNQMRMLKMQFEISMKEQTKIFGYHIVVTLPPMEKFKEDKVVTLNSAKIYILHAMALLKHEKLMQALDLKQQWEFMNLVGNLYYILGNDPQQNLELFKKSLILSEKWNVHHHHSQETQHAVIESYNTMGLALHNVGQNSEALNFWKKALSTALVLYGENHPDVATSYNNIGGALKTLGHAAEALELFQKALKIELFLNKEAHPAVATNYNNIGGALEDLGRATEALDFHQKSLKISLALYEENHPAVATSYGNIGSALKTLGRATEALGSHQKALKILLSLYGENHPAVATTYNNIGETLHTLGRAAEALDFYQKSLKISLALYGENHPAVATTYNNIGLALNSLGRATKALDFLQKALAIYLALYGENHPAVATSYNNIGETLRTFGRTAEALESHQKALKVRLSLYEENHPAVATSYNNIGTILQTLGRAAEALESHQKALKVRLSLYEENHPAVATSYANIGVALEDLGRAAEALESHQKALKIWVSLYEENHPAVATSYANIGGALKALGRAAEALDYLQKALKIWLALYEENHPDVATSYNNIGTILQTLGRAAEALESHQKALKISLALYGENHPHVAASYNNIGETLRALGCAAEALDSHQKALKIWLALYEETHPDVANSYNNIGTILQALRRIAEALDSHQKALAIRLALYGENHPDVANSYAKIGEALHFLGRNKEALDSFQKALNILLPLVGPQHPDVKTIQNNIFVNQQLSSFPSISSNTSLKKTRPGSLPCLQDTDQSLIYDLPSKPSISEVEKKQPVKIEPLQEGSFLSAIHSLCPTLFNFTTNPSDIKFLTEFLQKVAEQETFVFQGLFHKKIAPIYQSLDSQLANDLLHHPENPTVKTILQNLGNDENAFRSYFPRQELNLFLNSIFRTFYDDVFNDYATKKSELYLSFLRNVHNPLAFEEITPAFQELQSTIHGWLAEKNGLTASSWDPTQPIDDLLKTLREAGPLIVVGSFGKTYYTQPPLELKPEFSKKIQGWKSGTNRVMTPKSHTVILLGVTKNPSVNGGGYVYFFDPHQPSDSQPLQNDLFYKISYQNLQTHVQHFELLPGYAVHLSKRGAETTQKMDLLESRTSSASPEIAPLSKDRNFQGFQGDKATVAALLWKNPQALISDDMVEKVNQVALYLHSEGFELGGIAADGNCFLNAFLESYQTLSRKIPILDEQPDRVAYLRTCIAAEYPQDSAKNRERVNQIKKDMEWITAQGEGDLLAKGLLIPIRIVTVHQDLNGWGISDMLAFLDKEISRKEWKTISEQDRPQEYVFMVDLGGHFLYAKKSGGI